MSMRTELLNAGFTSLGLVKCACCGKEVEMFESNGGSRESFDQEEQVLHRYVCGERGALDAESNVPDSSLT